MTELNIDNFIAQKGTLDDLLFRGKNKDYGAYFLRKMYPENIKKSLLIFLALVCAIALSYVIYDKLKDKVNFGEVKTVKKVTELKAPPPLEDKKQPPPPPPPPPPPVKATIQFVPPKVVEVAAPEEEIKTVEEVVESKAAIATSTVVGQDLPDDIGLEDSKGTAVEAPKQQEPFTFVEQMPEFPGGEDALMSYLSRNIKYPAYAQENEIEGTVMINFVVGPDGTISQAKVTKGIKGGCDEEALRVVRSMPKWKPGKQGGQAVPVYFDVPVIFTLGE